MQRRYARKSYIGTEILVHALELEFNDCEFIIPELETWNGMKILLSGHYIKTFRTRDVYDRSVCSQASWNANAIEFFAVVRRFFVPSAGSTYICGYAFSKCKSKLEMTCALNGISLS